MKRRGWKKFGRKVTVAIMVGMRETKHRGPTLKAALRTAERARIPRGCHVKWYWGRHKGAGGVVKKRGVGRQAVVLLDGALFCGTREKEPVYGIVYRPHRQGAFWKQHRLDREAYARRGF